MARRLAVALRRPPLRCGGVDLRCDDGEAALLEVCRAHLHVSPRSADDGSRIGARSGTTPPTPRPGRLDGHAQTLRAALAGLGDR